MNRRSTDSPDKSSLNRLSSPPNQWQTRSISPNNIGTNQLNQFNAFGETPPFRANVPIGSNPFPTFGPNFGNQRFFTPRSSYFGQNNDNSGFNSTANMNPNFNYGQNYPNYGYNQAPTRPQPLYNISDSNRPVYSTDLSNISLDNESITQLKNALLNANREQTETKNQKCDSPESTVICGDSDSKPNAIKLLINEITKITEKENEIKRTRKDVEKKITELDEELRNYEKKFEFREKLKKIKESLDNDEEEMATKRQKIILDMEKEAQKLPTNELNKDSNESQNFVVSETEEKNSKTTKKVESNVTNQTNIHLIPKPAIKRPNPSSEISTSNKKVRIQSLVSQSNGVSAQLRAESPVNTPKVSKKPPIKRTPIPSKSTLTTNSTPGVGSPKVNRICRQQTPKPTENTVTSGVRTSRPQKMMSSRSKRNELSAQTSEPSIATEPTPNIMKAPEKTPVTPKKASETDSIEPESDSEVLKELEKISSQIDTNLNQISGASNQRSLPETVLKNKNDDILGEQMPQTSDEPIGGRNQKNLSKSDTTVKNVEKKIEIVDIDSGDEDFTSPQELIKVKTEKPDSIEDQVFEDRIREEANNTEESQQAKGLWARVREREASMDSMASSKSSEYSDTSEKNSTNESPFKVPTESVTNNKHKFYGFEPIEYEPTISYTLSSFKAIAGPKSKTVNSTVIFLKSFKDYLFASFMDQSVRRYHIEDKHNVIKFEGHEGIVLALTIIECPKSPGLFILYTGGKDKKLRAFNAISGQLLNSIVLNDEINCIVYNWSHIFCAQNDGTVSKVKPIHEIEEQTTDKSDEIKSFIVDAKKPIRAIVSVKAIDPPNSDVEALVAVSSLKLRIVNTIDSISDEKRILYSIPVRFFQPIFIRTFGNILIISYKCPPVKNEDKTKGEDRSQIIMMDLQNIPQKDWKPLKVIDVNGLITTLDLFKKDLIIGCYSGKVQCIDCEKQELKWISYGFKVTAAVTVGDRLVLGNDQGSIDVVYMDQTFMDCQTCGVSFARQIDFKQHIKLEHKSSESSDEEQPNK